MLSMLEGVRVLNTGNFSWNDLSEYQQENMNAGLKDVEAGRVISSEEFWAYLENQKN